MLRRSSVGKSVLAMREDSATERNTAPIDGCKGASNRLFAKLATTVDRLDIQRPPATIANRAVDRMFSDAALHRQGEVGFQTPVHAFEVQLRVQIRGQLQLDASVHRLKFQIT